MRSERVLALVVDLAGVSAFSAGRVADARGADIDQRDRIWRMRIIIATLPRTVQSENDFRLIRRPFPHGMAPSLEIRRFFGGGAKKHLGPAAEITEAKL